MKVRDYILEGSTKSAEERLAKLQEMGAPAVMIDGQKNIVDELHSGNLKIGGDVELLDEEYISREFKKGNGGKVYIQINGTINFFPNAKYGMYIKRA